MQKKTSNLIAAASLFLSSALADESLEKKLIGGEFLLTHNFWSLEHLHGATRIQFLNEGMIDIAADHPVITSNEWKALSDVSFSIGDHVFVVDTKHGCYYSPHMTEIREGEEEIHMGFHVIEATKAYQDAFHNDGKPPRES